MSFIIGIVAGILYAFAAVKGVDNYRNNRMQESFSDHITCEWTSDARENTKLIVSYAGLVAIWLVGAFVLWFFAVVLPITSATFFWYFIASIVSLLVLITKVWHKPLWVKHAR